MYDSAINICIISYLLTKKEKKGKGKGKKGKNLFCFVCMILLLYTKMYMCLYLVIKINCMYTWWVDCSMSYVNCFLIVPSCYWRGLYRHSLLSNPIDLSIKYLKWNEKTFEEISKFSNGNHLGWRTGLTDLRFKGYHCPWTITVKFGVIWFYKFRHLNI